jgi:PGM1 C-terminal domain
VKSFDEVQRLLPDALMANRPASGVDHVLVALPSYSVGESLLSHYADRIPALEHRYLVSRGAGVVLHMLSGLAIDGRLGLTAIGADQGEAAALHTAAVAAIGRCAQAGSPSHR